jgi:hypothetical protein
LSDAADGPFDQFDHIGIWVAGLFGLNS